jgi:hypothetical protein
MGQTPKKRWVSLFNTSCIVKKNEYEEKHCIIQGICIKYKARFESLNDIFSFTNVNEIISIIDRVTKHKLMVSSDKFIKGKYCLV